MDWGFENWREACCHKFHGCPLYIPVSPHKLPVVASLSLMSVKVASMPALLGRHGTPHPNHDEPAPAHKLSALQEDSNTQCSVQWCLGESAGWEIRILVRSRLQSSRDVQTRRPIFDSRGTKSLDITQSDSQTWQHLRL